MNSKQFSILYVDDEENNLISFKAVFRRDFDIHTATNGRDAIKLLREHDIQLVITDQRMPEMTGVQFLEAIVPEFPDAIRMILTGFSDVASIIKAINSGRVYRYVTKPWDEDELRMTIRGALEYYALQQEKTELLLQLQEKVSEQERVMKLFQKYVPESVVESVVNSRSDATIFDGESRIVSVLFSDIRDFTMLASRLDPKLVVMFLNDYFTAMTQCVVAHMGTVNKYIGDAIFAIFGAPVSYIENQHNAVLCALAMKERLQQINAQYSDILGMQVEIGIGVHTGEVIVGNIGSEERIEYTAIGDTVNVSSRIESLTKGNPNCILISENTYRAVSDDFEVNEWEPVKVKGKLEKIKVYEVVGKRIIGDAVVSLPSEEVTIYE
jgi:adenylate cyclase